MQRFLRNNGLTLVYLALFMITLAIMSVAGHRRFNEQLREHQALPVNFGVYLQSGDFVEGVFENWESEFLQMGTFVLFTVFLFQRGSAESKPLDERTPQDTDPKQKRYQGRPWALRKGGLWLKLYMNSLAIALFALFVFSLVVHAVGGTWAYNEEQLAHGGTPIGVFAFVTTSDFWFQSMQNWQSEFLAVASLAVLSIFLRQHGSPESKPVAAPDSQTGG